jgi:hypothetical protein
MGSRYTHSRHAAAADTECFALAGEEAQEKLARLIGACKLVVLDVSQNQLVSCCSKASAGCVVHILRATAALTACASHSLQS